MAETRDIAIEAKASATSAHKRLDSYNGQIARLARAVEGTNEKLDVIVNDPTTGLRAEISTLRADVREHVARLAVIVAVVSIIFGAGASALASHFLSQHPAPAVTTSADGR